MVVMEVRSVVLGHSGAVLLGYVVIVADGGASAQG